VNSKIDLDLREAVFARLLVKGQRFFARFRTGEGITGIVAETGAPILVHNLCSPPANLKNAQRGPIFDEGTLLAVPMLHKGRVVGVLDFYASTPYAFDP
jgi:putative methionine-R-sulfoxide reductase with GAF domain